MAKAKSKEEVVVQTGGKSLRDPAGLMKLSLKLGQVRAQRNAK